MPRKLCLTARRPKSKPVNYTMEFCLPSKLCLTTRKRAQRNPQSTIARLARGCSSVMGTEWGL